MILVQLMRKVLADEWCRRIPFTLCKRIFRGVVSRKLHFFAIASIQTVRIEEMTGLNRTCRGRGGRRDWTSSINRGASRAATTLTETLRIQFED